MNDICIVCNHDMKEEFHMGDVCSPCRDAAKELMKQNKSFLELNKRIAKRRIQLIEGDTLLNDMKAEQMKIIREHRGLR